MAQNMSVIQTLKELGPWVISFMALMQPWAISAWKRFVQKGKVEIHESGTIEVGHGPLGPSIALAGTLRALKSDIFVRQIHLSVTRRKDGATIRLNWRFSRSLTIPLDAQQSAAIELACSFLLSQDHPYKYNIVFVEDSFGAEMKARVMPLAKAWQEFIREKLDALDNAGEKPDYTVLQNPAFSESLWDAFGNTQAAQNAFAVINNAFPWQVGEHELCLLLDTSSPTETSQKRWRFILSDQDIENLRLNVVHTLRESCGLKATHNYAYPAYESVG